MLSIANHVFVELFLFQKPCFNISTPIILSEFRNVSKEGHNKVSHQPAYKKTQWSTGQESCYSTYYQGNDHNLRQLQLQSLLVTLSDYAIHQLIFPAFDGAVDQVRLAIRHTRRPAFLPGVQFLANHLA